MSFKYAVIIPPHSLFRILSDQISPKSTSNGSNSTSQQCNSNCTLKRCIVTIPIAKNNNNSITVGKAFNLLMKVIYGVEGYANKVKIAPWKSKRPTLKVLK